MEIQKPIPVAGNTIPDVDIIEAVIYAMANKFLSNEELNAVKEALENAHNFFVNGASFELVHKSIKTLSDEVLHEIYDEVMSSKKTK